MNINCNNKGCLKTSEALLDTKTTEVICIECGKAITNVSEAFKRALKQAGQIVRANLKKAFMLYCKKCNANREVILDNNNNTVCKNCHYPIAISASFKMAMKETGYSLEKLEDEQ